MTAIDTIGKVQSLTLEQFTAFEKATFEFCAGINVLIGTNGTGKTHVLKVMYALLKGCELARQRKGSASTIQNGLYDKLYRIFLPQNLENLIRLNGLDHSPRKADLLLTDAQNIQLRIEIDDEEYGLFTGPEYLPQPPPLVYLPADDFLALNKGFIAAYTKREQEFDETYYDLSVALDATPLRQPDPEIQPILTHLGQIIGGSDEDRVREVVFQQNGRFYFNLPEGTLEAHLVAEGYRKLGTLLYLLKNGSLTKDSLLFWDEPDTHLNPKLTIEVVKILQKLAAAGMQIFVTTHDFLLSYELSLLAEYPRQDSVDLKFFSLHKPDRRSGIEVETGQTMADLQHNVILDEFSAHYDHQVYLFQEELARDETTDAAI